MSFIVDALKCRLGAFGWSESVRRDQRRAFKVPAQEVRPFRRHALLPVFNMKHDQAYTSYMQRQACI